MLYDEHIFTEYLNFLFANINFLRVYVRAPFINVHTIYLVCIRFEELIINANALYILGRLLVPSS